MQSISEAGICSRIRMWLADQLAQYLVSPVFEIIQRCQLPLAWILGLNPISELSSGAMSCGASHAFIT
jgi:hypothetical protein